MISAPPPGPPLSDQDVDRFRRAAQSARVLVVGSLNVDLILKADHEPGDEGAAVVHAVSTEVGGHAGNCAAALAALGCFVAVAGAVGVDADGDRLLTDLTSRGIDVSGVRRHEDQPTGRVVIPVFGEKHYMLLCRGANEAFLGEDLRAVIGQSEYDAVVLFDPPRQALRQVGPAVNGLSQTPLLCWTPGGVFSADPVAGHLLPHCDVVFVNRAERRQLTEAARALDSLASHAELVTTLGEGGAAIRTGDVELTVATRPVPVVDPTGAGDAFAAAYVIARLAALPTRTRLAIANAGGAAAVGVTGARTHPATIAELLHGLGVPAT